MSIVESLKKIIDPVQARAREAERKTLRETPKRESDGDSPRFRCRVCKQEDVEGSYCPICLADTMTPLPRRPPE